jgi:hypothetical protein
MTRLDYDSLRLARSTDDSLDSRLVAGGDDSPILQRLRGPSTLEDVKKFDTMLRSSLSGSSIFIQA